MPMLGVLFAVNRGNLTKAKLYKTMRSRLRKEPGCHKVRLRPSRARPRTIETQVTPTEFLGQAYPVADAKLEVSFSYPRHVDHEYYVIEWSEAERAFGLGWHQDEDHPDLGECHLQLDHGGTTIDRVAATFVDEHPLDVFETRLDELRTLLPCID